MSTLNVQFEQPSLTVETQNVTLDMVTTTLELVVNAGAVHLPDGAPYYEHIQSLPAAIWTINHNLGRMPSVTVTTSAGDVVVGHVSHGTANSLTITFSAAFAGRAYLV